MAEARIEQVDFGGWPHSYRISNGTIELVATSAVGPRIIRFGFVGERNLFKVFADQLGKTGGDEWRIYGGHRLWHAPEGMPRSYQPDNAPVAARVEGNTLLLEQPIEPGTGIRKEMRITMDAAANHVTVQHRLYNQGLWPVTLAVWALTSMDQGGVAIIPQPPYAPHPQALLPAQPLVLWPYTDMSDRRWTWGRRYVVLRQDPTATAPQKAGFGTRQGWVAYGLDGFLFVKRFRYADGGLYPDMGSSVETFTNADMLELETLGPLRTVPPAPEGQPFVEHVEDWYLFRDVHFEPNDDRIDSVVLPRIDQTAK